jgi:hypothetical protein
MVIYNDINDVIRKLNNIKKKHKNIKVYIIADQGMRLEKVSNVTGGYIRKDYLSGSIDSNDVFTQVHVDTVENPEDYELVVIVG